MGETMKVLVASTGPEPESKIAKRFGHAAYYQIVERRTGLTEIVDNREREDDGSHDLIANLVRKGVEVVVTANIGPQAFCVVRGLHARVALARNMTVAEALEKLDQGELRFLDTPTLSRSVHDH
jgi:predicted Fe-Mo cluster-binding NifX family protein